MSIFNFLQNVKFAIIEHFMNEEESFLCTLYSEEYESPNEFVKYLLDEKFATELLNKQNQKSELEEKLVNVEYFRREFPQILKFLQQSGIKLGFLNKTQSLIRNLLTSTLILQDFKKRILACSKDLLDELKNLADNFLPERIKEEFNVLFQNDSKPAEDDNKKREPEASQSKFKTEKPEEFKKWAPSKKRKWEIENRIFRSSNRTRKNDYSSLRNAVVAFFETLLRKHIHGEELIKKPFLFDRKKVLDKAFSLNLVQTISETLTNPKLYLTCDCCKYENDDDYDDTMDDTVVAFKILRYIGDANSASLYEWFVAFSDVFQVNDDEIDEDEDKPRPVDPLLLGRFIRAVCELQYMGFWKLDSDEVVKKLVDIAYF